METLFLLFYSPLSVAGTDNGQLAQQLLKVLSVLSGVADDALEPLAPAVNWAVGARRAGILDRLDRAASVVERAGQAAHHLLARERGVLLPALLVQIVHL